MSSAAYKGMKTEHARRVKKVGHDREDEFASLIGGTRITGHGKGDVRDLDGKIHSLKAPDKDQLQICLHSKSTLSEVFCEQPLLAKQFEKLLLFPAYLNDYRKERNYYKSLLVGPIRDTVTLLQDCALLYQFLSITFFAGTLVDFLTIISKDFNAFYTFSRVSVLEVLQRAVIVPSGPGKGRGGFIEGCQKVCFKYPVGLNGKLVTVGEIEVRREKFHMNEFKFWMQKSKLVSLLCNTIVPYRTLRDPNYCPPPSTEFYQNKLPWADQLYRIETKLVHGQEFPVKVYPLRKPRS